MKSRDQAQLVHDDIMNEAETSLKNVIHKAWRAKRGSLEPFIIAWPQDPLLTDDGWNIVTNHIVSDLPKDRSRWPEQMALVIERTKPIALLMGEQRETEVVVIFETRLGTRSWRYPIKQHGRSSVLSEPVVRNNVDSIGVLWRRAKAQPSPLLQSDPNSAEPTVQR